MYERLVRAAQAARLLVFYNGAVDTDPVVRVLGGLVDALVKAGGGVSGKNEYGLVERLWQLARELTIRLFETGPVQDGRPGHEPRPDAAEPARTPWFVHIVEAVLTDDNAFSRAAALADSPDRLPLALREAAAHDLRCLQALVEVSPADLEQALHASGVPWPAGLWSAAPARVPGRLRPRQDLVEGLHRLFGSRGDFASCLDDLVAYYRAVGAGVVGQFAALRWNGSGLVGVAHPDPIRFEQMVGYEHQREQVIRNTERFVAGLPAHHLLLYGPRGTGKSATVKALLHLFADRGLRLVELPGRHLSDLVRLFGVLRGHRQRFIVFIDDLSFSDAEPSYKELKATLEGSVEACPPNVLVYATSNRRHLVKEGPRDDGAARPQDDVNERLSLADRFGVTVYFPPADQALYLRVVEGVARQAGIQVVGVEGGDTGGGPGPRIDVATLHRRALEWAMLYNDRSPRTAVQFVTQLTGELWERYGHAPG